MGDIGDISSPKSEKIYKMLEQKMLNLLRGFLNVVNLFSRFINLNKILIIDIVPCLSLIHI